MARARVALALLACLALAHLAHANADDEDDCACTSSKLCSGPFYKIKNRDTCDSGEVCCKRSETKFRSCGTRDSGSGRSNVDDGENALVDSPWTAAVLKVGSPSYQLLGGGSLVHPGVILTAAHVVQGVNTSELSIRFASSDLNPSSESTQVRKVVRVLTHPLFDSELLANDVALLVLDAQADLSHKVRVLCMPSHEFDTTLSNCKLAGWGKDSRSVKAKTQTSLKEIGLDVIERHQCQEVLRIAPAYSPFLHLHSGALCTVGQTPDQRPCKGDGGSPLYCWKNINTESTDKEEGYFVQMGVASFGASCGTGDVTPAVFASVFKYKDWMDDVIGRLTDGMKQFKL